MTPAVNTPAPLPADTFMDDPSPIAGVGLTAVGAYTTPRASTALPPALLTVPPMTAENVVMLVTVGDSTVGGGAAAVVTVIVGP